MLRRIASAALALSLACSAHGQSDPSGFATVINFPGDLIPNKINGGSQLNIFDGATDIPSIFVDEEFTSGGFSEVNFYGGEMTRGTFVRGDTAFNLLGAKIIGSYESSRGGVFNQSGGMISTIWSGVNGPATPSTVSLSGGSSGRLFTKNATVDLSGGEFYFNSQPVAGLDAPGDSVVIATELTDNETISGVLSDGTPFVLARQNGDRIETGQIILTRTELPIAPPADLISSVDAVPRGLRNDQTLVVDSHVLRTELPLLNAGHGSQIHVVPGGSLGSFLKTVGSEVSVAGGVAGFIEANHGSSFSLSSGSIDDLSLTDGASAEVSGGNVLKDLTAWSGAHVSITGGEIGEDLLTTAGSTAVISGGVIDTAVLGGDVQIHGEPVIDRTLVAGRVTYTSGQLGTVQVYTEGDFTVDGGYIEPFAWVSGRIEINNGVIDRGLQVTGQEDPQEPSNSTTAELHLRGGQIGDSFRAGENGPTLINISGGSIGDFADARAGSIWNITGGEVGGGFEALSGSEVSLQGGKVNNLFRARSGSTVRISEGSIEDSFEAGDGSQVFMSGGEVGDFFLVNAGSNVAISDGVVGRFMKAESGSDLTIAGGLFGDSFQALSGSDIELFGTEFLLDGAPVPGLEAPGDSILLTERGGAALTGRYANGDPIDFTLEESVSLFGEFFESGAMLTLTLILPGDYNLDGVVDGSDRQTWADSFGNSVATAGEGADGNFDGRVDAADYTVWRDHLGSMSNSSTHAVPEPHSFLCAAALAMAACSCRISLLSGAAQAPSQSR